MTAVLTALGVGAMAGFVLGLVAMGAAASGKVERAEHRLDEAGRESDETAARAARWMNGTPFDPEQHPRPPVPPNVCIACRLGECDRHPGGRSL